MFNLTAGNDADAVLEPNGTELKLFRHHVREDDVRQADRLADDQRRRRATTS